MGDGDRRSENSEISFCDRKRAKTVVSFAGRHLGLIKIDALVGRGDYMNTITEEIKKIVDSREDPAAKAAFNALLAAERIYDYCFVLSLFPLMICKSCLAKSSDKLLEISNRIISFADELEEFPFPELEEFKNMGTEGSTELEKVEVGLAVKGKSEPPWQ